MGAHGVLEVGEGWRDGGEIPKPALCLLLGAGCSLACGMGDGSYLSVCYQQERCVISELAQGLAHSRVQ